MIYVTHEQTSLQTKAALASSLKKFMQKKPLCKITVSEIIADCNVNRKTFYYHFEDIYALLKWILEQEAIEVVKNFDLLIDYEDAVRFVIEYVKNNAHLLCCAYDSMGRDELKRFFYNDFSSLTENLINNIEEQYNISVTDGFKTFLREFLTEVTAGMLVNGFREKRNIDPDIVIGNITVILNTLPDMLKRAPQKRP